MAFLERCPSPLVLTCSLLLGACVGDDPDSTGDTTGDTEPATTGADGTDTTDDSNVSGTVDESGGVDTALLTCQEPLPLPPAPVDCNGAIVIPNDVYIEPQSGYPADQLEGVRRVEGSISINRTDVADLDFMTCLEEVTGSITIYGNYQLTSVDGLWNLRMLGGDFIFSENDALVDFDGLPNLVTIPGSLVIKSNDALQTLGGFHQLEAVGDLYVQSNVSLQHVDGLGGLRTVDRMFAITNNTTLCLSSVNCVGLGITDPAQPRSGWSTRANDGDC